MGRNKVVLILPDLYDYGFQISEALKRQGYEAAVYYEQPPTMRFLVLKRLGAAVGMDRVFRGFNRKLFERIARENSGCSHFIVIRGNILDGDMLQRVIAKVLKQRGTSSYYSWDSFNHLCHGGSIGNVFDRRFTFDSEDAGSHRGWKLLPLFYTSEYDLGEEKEAKQGTDRNEKKYDYDLCCITGFSMEKYALYRRVAGANPNLRILCRMYMGKSLQSVKKLMGGQYREIDPSVLVSRPLSAEEIVGCYRRSRAVLDLPSSTQSGLSMRTIESLGMRKKIVTSNPHIREYEFFSCGNALVLEGDFRIPEEWFGVPYELEEDVRRKYSIDSWVRHFL